MTKEEALELMRQYAEAARADIREFTDAGVDSGLVGSMEHLISMPARFPSDGSEQKAMRWLGFMQGVLFAASTYTLEELKDHSRRKSL